MKPSRMCLEGSKNPSHALSVHNNINGLWLRIDHKRGFFEPSVWHYRRKTELFVEPNRCRRLSKDWECLNRNVLTFLRRASVRLMVRKLCNGRSDIKRTLRGMSDPETDMSNKLCIVQLLYEKIT